MTMPERSRSRLNRPSHTSASSWISQVLKDHTPWLPWLGLTALGSVGLVMLVTSTPPAQIADVGLPRLYLAFQVLTFLVLASLAVILWKHIRRGILTGAALQVLILLHLQHVILGWQLLSAVLISFVIIELGFIYLVKPTKKPDVSPHRPNRPFDHVQRSAV